MFETFNLTVFNLLNAPVQADPAMISFAGFVAEKLLFVEALVMVVLWLTGSQQRRHALVVAGMTVVLALLVNAVIGSIWQHPRPFVIGVGQQYLEHAADSSFPSDHGTLMFGVAFGLLLAPGGRVMGIFALVAALLVAWSRVYLGIHWPLDMIGAMVVAGAAGFGVTRWMPQVSNRISGLMNSVFNAVVARFR